MTGVDWRLYHFNRAAWQAAVELCEGAERTIEIEQFIFEARGIGRRILDLLAARARQGLRVRVLADAFGSPRLLKSELGQALLRAGGEIRIFHRYSEALRAPSSLIHRLHRKTLIADNARLMVGGSCFSPRMRHWRDTMAVVDDRWLAGQAVEAFDLAWHATGRGENSVGNPVGAGRDVERREWSYLVRSPYPSAGLDYWDLLRQSILGARHRVRLTTPYFLPGRRLRHALATTARRGVDLRILIPARSDHRSVDILSRYFARRLVREGVGMFGYEPGMLHAKVAVIDDDLAAVGSLNLGIDSTRFNLEGGVVTWHPSSVALLAEQLDRDFAQSSPFE